MEIMKMNNLLKNILMGIFAVMLLTSTLTLGVQNGINTPKSENKDVKLGSVHPVIQIAEAAKEIDSEIDYEEYLKKINSNNGVGGSRSCPLRVPKGTETRVRLLR
jgi:hypothetical protein